MADTKATSPGLIDKITKLLADPGLLNMEYVDTKNTGEGVNAERQEPTIFTPEGKGGGDKYAIGKSYGFANLFPNGGARRTLYAEYEELESTFGEIQAAMDMYADYTTMGGSVEYDHSYSVYCTDKEYEDEIKTIEQRTQVKDMMWILARGMIRDGDEFVELIADKDGLAKIRPLAKHEMFRAEDEYGNLPLENAFCQQRGDQRALFDQWQVVHFRARSDLNSLYGRGILYGLRRLAKVLELAEDAVAITRLSRAHSRLKFTIDVGDADAARAQELVEQAKRANSQVRTIDPRTGRMRLKQNPLLAEEHFYIPRGTNGTANVETIAGDQSILRIDDLLHWYDRLFASLKISKAWFGLTGPNIRSVVGEQGLNFMRTVRRYRKCMIDGMNKIYTVGLALQGVPVERLKELELTYKFPLMTHADDELHFNLLKIKLEVAKEHNALKTMCRFDILTKIMGYEDREAKAILKAVDKERKDDPDVYGTPPAPEGEEAASGGEAPPTKAPTPPGFNTNEEQEQDYRPGIYSRRSFDAALTESVQSPAFRQLVRRARNAAELVKDSLPIKVAV